LELGRSAQLSLKLEEERLGSETESEKGGKRTASVVSAPSGYLRIKQRIDEKAVRLPVAKVTRINLFSMISS